MSIETKTREFVERLIAEGEAVLTTEWKPGGDWVSPTGPPRYVEIEAFRQWQSRCHLLLSMLGPLGKPWEPILGEPSGNELVVAKSMQGALKAIRLSIDEGLLIRFEDIVLAEAFSDLQEQAEYLYKQDYFLAAAVIARAILEERLRRLCYVNECIPGKKRPTIGDLNIALYKQSIYDKVTYKHVDAITAIGNDAAHNNPDLAKEDVRRLLKGLRDFLIRFAV